MNRAARQPPPLPSQSIVAPAGTVIAAPVQLLCAGELPAAVKFTAVWQSIVSCRFCGTGRPTCAVAVAPVPQVRAKAAAKQRVLVCLDSNHTHEHVLSELDAYAPLTTIGSYCVVFDTVIEDTPAEVFVDRPWGPGKNPKTAVRSYLKSHPEFVIDKEIGHKLLISVAPDGYLKRVA